MVSISEFQSQSEPFIDPVNGAQLTKDNYVSIKDLVGQPIEILEIHDIENDYGPGVSFMFRNAITQEVGYSLTHAVALTDILKRPALREVLAKGEVVEATLQQAPSKSNPGRKMYRFV